VQRDTSYDKNIKIIGGLFWWLLYLCFTNHALKSSSEIAVEKKLDQCKFDSKAAIWNYVCFILSPVLIVKIYGHVKYMNRFSEEFKDFYRRSNYFMHVLMGGWTLYHMIGIYGQIPSDCRSMASFSLLNYEIAILVGTYSATQFILAVLLISCCIAPLALYIRCRQRKERLQRQKRQKKLLESLISEPYDNEKFKDCSVECSICLDEFSQFHENHLKRNVTPLPCNSRHIYHSDCIKAWLKQKDECPLCKKLITYEDCLRLKNERYEMQMNNSGRSETIKKRGKLH